MQRNLWLHFVFALLFLSTSAQALEEINDVLPLWDYGIGVGAIRFWQYPASNQSREWILPFPTFQYRGEILRADDREGARAYLWRESLWSLEMGGGFLPSLKSEDSEARQGMQDLPWRFELGPQWVSHFHSPYQIKLGVYQVVVTADVKNFRTQGILSELELLWHLEEPIRQTALFGQAQIRAQLGLTFTAASREFHELYFEVPLENATVARPQYSARAGFLSYEISYFQAVTWRPWGFYFGGTQEFFQASVNRASPLHKSDQNLSLFVGVTYLLGESSLKAVPESEAEGAFEKIQHRYHQR